MYGDPASLGDGEPVLTRVHSECLTGDVFGSERCDCGPQLNEAMDLIVKEGRGVVIYLRGHEGRGIGLLAKLQAYQLQDGGRDTVDANLDLGLPGRRPALRRGHPDPARPRGRLGPAADQQPRQDLRAWSPTASPSPSGWPLTPRPNDHNLAYLLTKRDRMGHHSRPDASSVDHDRSTPVSGDGSPPRHALSTAATCRSPWSRRAGTSR